MFRSSNLTCTDFFFSFYYQDTREIWVFFLSILKVFKMELHEGPVLQRASWIRRRSRSVCHKNCENSDFLRSKTSCLWRSHRQLGLGSPFIPAVEHYWGPELRAVWASAHSGGRCSASSVGQNFRSVCRVVEGCSVGHFGPRQGRCWVPSFSDSSVGRWKKWFVISLELSSLFL